MIRNWSIPAALLLVFGIRLVQAVPELDHGAGYPPPPKYQFTDNASPVYEVTIRSDMPTSVETQSGHISYFIKSVDPTNGQILLDYSAQLQTSRQSKVQENQGGWPPRPPMPPMPPMPPNPFAPPPAPTDIMIDSYGNVIRSNRNEEDRQLPFLLGLNWQLLLQPLSPDNQPTWKKEGTIVLFDKKQQSQNRWPPAPPWQQQQSEERVERPAHQTTTFTLGATNGDLVTIQRTTEVATDEKVGDVPLEKLTGDGQIIFNIKSGLVQSLEFKQTFELNQDNITLRIPTTVSAHLLTAAEIAKMKADHAAAEAAARAMMSRQQARQEEDARRLLPTAEQTATELKSVQSNWKPATGSPVEVLSTMQGDCTRDPDGTVVLQGGHRITTGDSYAVPTTIRATVLTQDHDVRFGYAADQVIFNWEMNAQELRVDGGPANGDHKPGAGKLMPNRWIGIEWVVHPDEMIIYVNGVERYRASADFSELNKPFSIEAHNGVMWVKSVQIVSGGK